MYFNVVVLNIGEKNLNNHTYSKNVVNNMINDFNDKPIYGKIGMSDVPDLNLSEVSHVVTNLRIKEDKMMGTFSIMDNKNGDKLKKMLKNEEIVFRVQGEGNCNDDGEIIDFKLSSINAINKSEDAFGEKKC